MAIDWRSTAKAFPVLILDRRCVGTVDRIMPTAVELRLDLVGLPAGRRRIEKVIEYIRMLRRRRIAVLLTARLERDGGRWPMKEESARRTLLFELAPHADAVDIEYETLKGGGAEYLEVVRERMRKGGAVIMSHHDMKAMASRRKLESIRRRACEYGVDRLKIAALSKNETESERLSDWACSVNSASLPVTAIAMGESGQWTRWVLPLRLGGPAYAPCGRPVAPGQISYSEIKKLLKK